MAESLAEFFCEHFRAHPRERAYRQRRGYRTQSFTYGQVFAMAVQFARELELRSVGRGDRILLWGENSAEWVAAFFGCTLRGVVVVPMDDGASRDFALRVARQVDAKLLVVSCHHVEELPPDEPAIPMLVLNELSRGSSSEPGSFAPAPLTRDDTLQIVFTSGTTAEPRGVVITHGNVLANLAPLEREIRNYLKYERFVHPIRFLNLLPLSHVFGQFLGLFLPPLLAGTVIFQEELKPSEIVATIRREHVSVLVSVPRVLQSLKQKIERDLDDRHETASFRRRFESSKDKHFLRRWWIFRNIRGQFGWKFWAFICGGAALDRDTEEFWHRLGYAAIQGYGLTETTSLISVNHPFRLGRGSIGKVLPGREVKLAEDGEILVRGAGVASGYWRTAGEGQVADKEGWYRTGDIGALDADGNLYFKGRKKEVIITPGGTNVYPEDLEAALRQQPEVKDCVVVGIERDGNAEPCAVLVLREGARIEEVVQRANQALAEFQRMRLWMRWPDEDFPRTSTQKPRHNVIAEAAHAEILSPAQPCAQANTANGSAALQNLIARISGRPAAALGGDAKLDSDLGLGSLDRVELLGALEDRYQIDLSETRFSTVQTVGDLQRLLRGEAEPAKAYHYPAWSLAWPVNLLRNFTHYLLMRPAMILLGWPRIIGREHLHSVQGPLLVISNHIGDYDAGFILTALPPRLRHRVAIATGGEALEALRSPSPERNFFLRVFNRVRWTLGVSLLNLFPLPRQAGFRRSFAYAGTAVDGGYSVLVFPEGRHTLDGKLLPFRAGIGLLAANLGVPVLPMRIDGLFEAQQSGKRIVAPGKIVVHIGEPRKFTPGTGPEEIAAELQKAVESL